MSQQKIMFCPNCGADCSSVDPNRLDANKCPFCGCEIYDHSEEQNREKIEEVKRAEKKVLSAPKVVAITVVSTLAVLILITILVYVFRINDAATGYVSGASGNEYTKKMEKCYKKQDWDGLFDIVILDCEKALSSASYFTYRSAWFLSCYPEEFDEAIASGNTDRAKEIYALIKEDYKMRQEDYFYSFYDTIDEVEEGLKQEYLRETDIMSKMED